MQFAGTRLSLPSNINDSPPDDSPVWLRRSTTRSDTNVYVTHYIDEEDLTPTTDDTYFYTFYQDYVPCEPLITDKINNQNMPAGNKVDNV